METLIKKPPVVNEKVKKERRKLKKDPKPIVEHKKQVNILLSKSDHEDWIEIKRTRAEKQEKQRRMFFSIGLATTLLLVNIVFNWKFYDDALVDGLEMVQSASFEEILEVPPTQQQPPPPPSKVVQPKIVEVPDEEVLEEIDIELDVEVTEEMVVEEVIFEDVPMEEEKAEEIFQIVEHAPEPQGGFGAFYKYVGENIKYPAAALRQQIQGRVFVKFVVSKTGEIKQVQAVKGIGGGCDEEAVRIVQNAPKWKPGRQRGKNVNVYMMLPITFKLAN